MKKTVALCLVISTLAALVLTFTSCGGNGNGINGTYTYKDDTYGLETTYKFSGSNKVTALSVGMSFDGTYKLDGDTITISLDTLGENTYSFARNGKNIIIEGTEYIKK